MNRHPSVAPKLAALFLLGLTLGPAMAAEYKVNVDGCPTPVAVSVPQRFTPALDSEAKKKRDSILDNLHANPDRTARYAEVFLRDWRSEPPLPSLMIGSMGAVKQIQGRVTEAQWQSLKREALSASKEKHQEWLKRGLVTLRAPSSVEAQVTDLISSRANEFTLFGQSASTSGTRVSVYTAAKTIYVHQCLIYLGIAVDSSDPGAQEMVIKYASQSVVR